MKYLHSLDLTFQNATRLNIIWMPKILARGAIPARIYNRTKNIIQGHSYK